MLLYQDLLSNVDTFLQDKKNDDISVRKADGPSRQILRQNLTWAIEFSNKILCHQL